MTQPIAASAAWLTIDDGRRFRSRTQSGQVQFYIDADTRFDGYVSYEGRTVGYIEDWGDEGCLFVPCITRCEDEHPTPLEADTLTELYELVCSEISLMDGGASCGTR